VNNDLFILSDIDGTHMCLILFNVNKYKLPQTWTP